MAGIDRSFKSSAAILPRFERSDQGDKTYQDICITPPVIGSILEYRMTQPVIHMNCWWIE